MKNLGKQVVVVDNGFVHVGDCSINGEMLKIENAKNIRRWGTERGLGQLRDGPVKGKTVSDDCGTILVPFGRVVFFLQLKDGADDF